MKNIYISEKSRLLQLAVLLGLIITSFNSYAQHYQTNDTIEVEEVTVTTNNLKRYQAGAKIEKIEACQVELMQDGNIEDLLSAYTFISGKVQGGSFSSIRLRGTSPDHTSINFGGININSLTLGQSNTSNVPVYLFDEIEIQYGSATVVNGSGSIGGALHLTLNNYWTKGVKAEIRIAHGSFGEQMYGTKIRVGNGKLESVTRAYFYAKRNNFTFMNTSVNDFENGVKEVKDTMKNARIENKGLIQEINYKFSAKEFFTCTAWFESDWHEVQQNMQTNYWQPHVKATILDNNVRIWTNYQNNKHLLKYNVGGGFVYDNSIYDANTDDTIQTKRFIAQADIEHDLRKNAGYKIGGKLTSIYPNVYAYDSDLKNETRIDLYLSYYHLLFDRLKFSVNLRQGFVTDFDVPFTPGIGASYLLLNKNDYFLKLTGNIARSYRVPTFNDRFWVPGGNPDLKPEEGMNYEIGATFFCSKNDWTANLQINGFYMDIDNWILWKNGGSYWYAENVMQVISKGIELSGDVTYPLSLAKLKSGFLLGITSTIRNASENNSNAIGRQMEYVPFLKPTFYTNVSVKKFSFGANFIYNDWMYSNEDDDDIIDENIQLNAYVKYQITLKQHQFSLNAMVNNILNVNYQSTYGYAMPGINYRLSFTYNLN